MSDIVIRIYAGYKKEKTLGQVVSTDKHDPIMRMLVEILESFGWEERA
ncbi:MAG: hypothetical protein AAB922_00610 [Patescibacteria group bacterium]